MELKERRSRDADIREIVDCIPTFVRLHRERETPRGGTRPTIHLFRRRALVGRVPRPGVKAANLEIAQKLRCTRLNRLRHQRYTSLPSDRESAAIEMVGSLGLVFDTAALRL